MPLLSLLCIAHAALQVHRAPIYIGESQAVVDAMETAFAGLDHHRIKVFSDEGQTTIDLMGKKVREEQGSQVWAFDGRTVFVRDRVRHVFVSGRCLRHRAAEVVPAVTGRRVDVVTRALLFRRAPLAEALVDANVRIAGYVAPGGVPCDIVRADASSVHTTIFVRRIDHLPQSVTTESLVNGHVVTTLTRNFQFHTIKASVFKLTKMPYEKLGPFPKLKEEKF